MRRVSEGSSRGVMSDELMAELTPAVYTKIEMELLKFALTSGDVTVRLIAVCGWVYVCVTLHCRWWITSLN